MTQDQHGAEWMKEAEEVDRARGVEACGKCPGCVAGNLLPFDHKGLPMARCDNCGMEVNDHTSGEKVRVPWGSWELGDGIAKGRWHHNPALTMSAADQRAQNEANGYECPGDDGVDACRKCGAKRDEPCAGNWTTCEGSAAHLAAVGVLGTLNEQPKGGA